MDKNHKDAVHNQFQKAYLVAASKRNLQGCFKAMLHGEWLSDKRTEVFNR